jgi:hypothetical protein
MLLLCDSHIAVFSLSCNLVIEINQKLKSINQVKENPTESGTFKDFQFLKDQLMLLLCDSYIADFSVCCNLVI